MNLGDAINDLAGFGDKPRRSSPEWKSWQLGNEAKAAEAKGLERRLDQIIDTAEALADAARTPALKRRHQDAFLTGRWT